VHELPCKLDPFVDRGRGHPSGFELLVKLFGMACCDLVDPDPLGHELFKVGYHLLPNRNRGRFAAFPLTLDVTIEKRFERRNYKLFGDWLWFDQPDRNKLLSQCG
jgi:hypothetical protein